MGQSRTRIILVCAAFALVFSGFSYRLVQLQLVQREEFTALAAQKHVRREEIRARRGAIFDAKGEVLAENVPVSTVIADATLIKNTDAVAAAVAEELGRPKEEIAAKLAPKKAYIILARKVPSEKTESLAARLKKENLGGIAYEQDDVRVYPNAKMLCHVVGFLNREGTGVQGVERTLDDYLRGTNGYRYIERDRKGRELVPYRGQTRAPLDGFDVRLTVDLALQNIVESELEAAVAQYKPKSAIAILMRPSTGEILALANRPCFDPNLLAEAKPEEMKNRAIIDMVEPGSTFKIVTASGAMNERLVDLDTGIFCENGRYSYAGKILRDHHPYGTLPVRDVLAKSSNIGSAKIAMQLGDARLYDYIRRYGFGEPTGIQLPGEIGGLVHPVHTWTKISITRVPMGQGVCVTPIQLVTAMGAIANGGRLMMPQIIQSVAEPSITKTIPFPPITVRQVVSADTAAKITSALCDVVSARGTAKLAAVPGYLVAGKTGTAQKADKGGYAPGKYVVSFVGFMPADDPQFVCLVMLDEAVAAPDQNYGGLVAAPVFSKIAERTARYLDIPPRADLLVQKPDPASTERD